MPSNGGNMMTKFHISIGAAALFLLLPGAAAAGTGNELLENCKKTLRIVDGESTRDADTVPARRCVDLIHTVMETTFIHASQLGKGLFCTPPGVSTEQAVRIVVKYLTSNPESLHQTDSVLVVEAMKPAFPCQ